MTGFLSKVRERNLIKQKIVFERAAQELNRRLNTEISTPENIFAEVLVSIPGKYHKYYGWIKEKEDDRWGPKSLDDDEISLKESFINLFQIFRTYMNKNRNKYLFYLKERKTYNGNPFTVKRKKVQAYGYEYAESTFAMHYNVYSVTWGAVEL